MEPCSQETEKDTSHSNNAEKEDDSEPVVHENEFEKCLRKGRRDACPDIHCKCADPEHSKECLFHKGVVDSNSTKESVKENTWTLKCSFRQAPLILLSSTFSLHTTFLFLVGRMTSHWPMTRMKRPMKRNFHRNGVSNPHFKEKPAHFN